VLEGQLQLREEADRVEQLGSLEPREAGLKLGVRRFRDTLEKHERDVLPDHGGRLEQALVFGRQPIDSSGQDRLDGGRYPDSLDRAGQAIAAALVD
jgi:hypothetical protein